MCTAITYSTKDHYFGRNLDLEYSYREEVTVVPRNFPFAFRRAGECKSHFALIGMAYVQDGYPLFYDAVNEKGLGMAGLNFPGNAAYFPEKEGKTNLSPFEFIPFLLARCATVKEARELLGNVNLIDLPFSKELPLTPLHWMIADKTSAIVAESTEEGLKVYENPVGVMTNNPPFPMQMNRLADYMALSIEPPKNNFAGLELTTYSRGMGAMGLPGDLSSASRFVKAAFTRFHSRSGESEVESVSQFFHILDSVEQQRGCVKLGEHFEITVYASCCNVDRGIYYYKTYDNSRLHGIDMHREDLDGSELARYPLIEREEIDIQN